VRRDYAAAARCYAVRVKIEVDAEGKVTPYFAVRSATADAASAEGSPGDTSTFALAKT
jgi:hypothetical protein